MAWDVVGVIVIYTFTVETKQLSLEELDEVFSAKNPKQASFELARAAREGGAQDARCRGFVGWLSQLTSGTG
ncbi:hypothetical protein CC85DRAFT_287479 [Cutaneotrichosporon oleaginosum]|uniref:Uncharacterized protein n=1 Tax=Cutaneotrichosporon oleaginosum TaxID=879819 RepID=A0A0J0XH06_9TREE|nr:uncharacterized protein CC85DRAFT_287479 [Cutaneotrichosporon oleaginosum]KLT40375.1 hypothetical protein CC85DRAFT_287479 [Cutaneotrichosporon oleaginosum]TXT11342.1 hypothetical protein COLE_01752 [Cutaneotrichosporon oleaginosum]